MNIVLIGDGGHGKVVRDLILLHRNYNLVALLDDKYKGTFTKDNVIFGPISSVDQIIKLYSDVKFVITIGDNKVRRDIVHKLNFPKKLLCYAYSSDGYHKSQCHDWSWICFYG